MLTLNRSWISKQGDSSWKADYPVWRYNSYLRIYQGGKVLHVPSIAIELLNKKYADVFTPILRSLSRTGNRTFPVRGRMG